jgi:hypothetical protein
MHHPGLKFGYARPEPETRPLRYVIHDIETRIYDMVGGS